MSNTRMYVLNLEGISESLLYQLNLEGVLSAEEYREECRRRQREWEITSRLSTFRNEFGEVVEAPPPPKWKENK